MCHDTPPLISMLPPTPSKIVFVYCVCGWVGVFRCVYIYVCVYAFVWVSVYVLWYAKAKKNRWLQLRCARIVHDLL